MPNVFNIIEKSWMTRRGKMLMETYNFSKLETEEFHTIDGSSQHLSFCCGQPQWTSQVWSTWKIGVCNSTYLHSIEIKYRILKISIFLWCLYLLSHSKHRSIWKLVCHIRSYKYHTSLYHGLHWENYISISFHIEWDMIVVTVFLSILNRMDFHLDQNRKETCRHDHIPFNMKGNGNIVFSV